MVARTTTGNLRDCFVKRPGQTSMYYRYGPWHCHVSAPHWGLLGTGRVHKKKLPESHNVALKQWWRIVEGSSGLLVVGMTGRVELLYPPPPPFVITTPLYKLQ